MTGWCTRDVGSLTLRPRIACTAEAGTRAQDSVVADVVPAAEALAPGVKAGAAVLLEPHAATSSGQVTAARVIAKARQPLGALRRGGAMGGRLARLPAQRRRPPVTPRRGAIA